MEKRVVTGISRPFKGTSTNEYYKEMSILLDVVQVITKLNICEEADDPSIICGYLRVYWYE
jgi:hypothetical protein